MKHFVPFISLPPSFSYYSPLSPLLCTQLFPFSFPVSFFVIASMPSRFISPSISFPPNFPLILYSSFILSNHPWQPFPFLVYFSFSFWIPLPSSFFPPSLLPSLSYNPFPLSLPFSPSISLSIISSSVTLFLLHHLFSSCAASNYSWQPCLLASFFFSHLLLCLPFLIFSPSAGPSSSTLYLPRIPPPPPLL